MGGQEAIITAVATLFATAITTGVGYLTNRASNRAAERNTQIQSKSEVEAAAFERAKNYLDETMEDQRITIANQKTEIATDRAAHAREIEILRGRVATLEDDRIKDHQTIADLRRELDVAKRALRIRYPDDEDGDI